MPVLFTQETNKNYVTQSNYSPYDSTVSRVWKHLEVSGTGVQKRSGWRRMDRFNKNTPLDYNKTWDKWDMGNKYVRHTESSGSSFFYHYEDGPMPTLYGSGEVEESMLVDANYKATAKLLNQLKGDGANLANMLGERKQVAGSVINTLQTLAYSARDIRRGNIASAIRRFGGDPKTARQLRGKDIAQTWLSLQYGWKPLLSDLYELVNNTHKRESSYHVFRCSSKQGPRVDASKTSNYLYNFPPGAAAKNCGLTTNLAIAKYMIRARPDMTFAEPAALGFTNPLGVLWEVTPWSFVVDWFLPIGDYLDQLTADHGWYFIDGCYSTLQKATSSGQCNFSRSYTSSGWTYTDALGFYGNTDFARFSRQTLSSFPSPKLPRFKNPFSTDHVWNAMALAYQAFGAKPPRQLGRRGGWWG